MKNSELACIVGRNINEALVNEESCDFMARLALMGGYELAIRNLSIHKLKKEQPKWKIKREYYDKKTKMRHDLFIDVDSRCKSVFEFKHNYLTQIAGVNGGVKGIKRTIDGIMAHAVNKVPDESCGNFVYIITNVIETNISDDLRAGYCGVNDKIEHGEGVAAVIDRLDAEFHPFGIDCKYNETIDIKCSEGAVSVSVIVYGAE